MNLSVIFMLIFANIVNSDKASDEGSFIHLLPKAQKEELLEKIARRILQEVQSQEVLAKSGEIPDSQLDQHSAYVSKLLNEERHNIKRKSNELGKAKHRKRNADFEDDSIKLKGLEKEEGSDGGEQTVKRKKVLENDERGSEKPSKEGIKSIDEIKQRRVGDEETEDGNQVLETGKDRYDGTEGVEDETKVLEPVEEGKDGDKTTKEGMKGLERVKEESDGAKVTEQLKQGIEKEKIYDGDEETEEEVKDLKRFKAERDGESRTKDKFGHIDLTLREGNLNDETVTIKHSITSTTPKVEKTEETIDFLTNKEYNIPSNHVLKGEMLTKSDDLRSPIVKIINNDEGSSNIDDNTNENTSIEITVNGKRPISKQAYIYQTDRNIVSIPVNVVNDEPTKTAGKENNAKNESNIYITRNRDTDKTENTTYDPEIAPDVKFVNKYDTQLDNPIDETMSLLLRDIESNVSKNIAKNSSVKEKSSNIDRPDKDKRNSNNLNGIYIKQNYKRVPSDSKVFVSHKHFTNSPIHVIVPIIKYNSKNDENINTESKINRVSADAKSEIYKNRIDKVRNHILGQDKSVTSENMFLTTVKMPNGIGGNKDSIFGNELSLEHHMDKQIENSKTFSEQQKYSANKSVKQIYEVYEIPAGSPPFTQNLNNNKEPETHFESRAQAEESSHYVPVYNYAPKNAFYNAYNRLGLNVYDLEDDIENKDSREDDVNDSNNLKYLMESDRKYQNNPVHIASNFNLHKQNEPTIAQHNKIPDATSNDYFDMDYYFGRSDNRSNLRNRRQRRHRKEKEILRELSLTSPNSYENDHPGHIPRNVVKDHLSAVRQAMSRNNILRSDVVTNSTNLEIRNLSNKRNVQQNVKQHNVKMQRKSVIKNLLASKHEDVVPLRIILPKPPRVIQSELDTYLSVMGNTIKSDNPGLYHYDWLGTAVDLQAALKKLMDLTKQLQAGYDIHSADLELLYYLLHLFKSSKNYLKHKRNSEGNNNNSNEVNNYNKYISENNSPKVMKYFDMSDISLITNKDDEESKQYEKTENSEYKSGFGEFDSEVRSPKKSKFNVKELSPEKVKQYLLSLIDHLPPKFRTSSNSNKDKDSKKAYTDLEVDPSEMKEVLNELKRNRRLEALGKPKMPYKLDDLTPWQINAKNNKDSEIKSPMPRARRKNSRRLINDISPLVPMFTKHLKNNFEDNLKDFEGFLREMQYALNDIHNAIKHIAMVSKYNKSLYKNLKELYLYETKEKTKVIEILIHIIATRLMGLIEDSVTEGLTKDYLRYIENNDKNVKETREEFVFLLRLLEKQRNIDMNS